MNNIGIHMMIINELSHVEICLSDCIWHMEDMQLFVSSRSICFLPVLLSVSSPRATPGIICQSSQRSDHMKEVLDSLKTKLLGKIQDTQLNLTLK